MCWNVSWCGGRRALTSQKLRNPILGSSLTLHVLSIPLRIRSTIVVMLLVEVALPPMTKPVRMGEILVLLTEKFPNL